MNYMSFKARITRELRHGLRVMDCMLLSRTSQVVNYMSIKARITRELRHELSVMDCMLLSRIDCHELHVAVTN